jgi:hypothetical protein
VREAVEDRRHEPAHLVFAEVHEESLRGDEDRRLSRDGIHPREIESARSEVPAARAFRQKSCAHVDGFGHVDADPLHLAVVASTSPKKRPSNSSSTSRDSSSDISAAEGAALDRGVAVGRLLLGAIDGKADRDQFAEVSRALLAMSVLALSPSVAAATTISLDYQAPDDCPAAEVFVSALKQRRLDLALGEGREVTTSIVRDGARYRGTIAFERVERTAEGDTCAEVVDALAVIASFGLPTDPPPPPVELETKAKAAPAPRADTGPVFDPDRVAPPESAKTRWSFGAGVGATAMTLPSVTTAFGLGAALDLRAKTRTLSPLLSLSFVRTAEAAAPPLGRGVMQWSVGRLDACPHVFSVVSSLELAPCATFAAGELEVASDAFGAVDSRRRPWVTAGLGARFLARSGPFFAALQVGAALPLVRDVFAASRRGSELTIPFWVGDAFFVTGVHVP